MKICVLVPSYRRSEDLLRCLEAIARQTRAADQMVLVVRTGDSKTFAVARTWQNRLPLRVVETAVSGVVQAMNLGLAHVEADVVAMTDDDAAPRPEWLAGIESHFDGNPDLGGVGGRDWVQQNGKIEAGSRKIVGRVCWFGRFVGNHHLGAGPARYVDILKGVNCSFRMAAIRTIGLDTRLLGSGAQVHWELCLCFAIKRAGWRLLYDPEVAVDHFPAPRFDRDGRNRFDPIATADRSYNFRLALGDIFPRWRRITALIWHHLIGTNDEPGLVNLLRMLIKRDPYAMKKYRAAHNQSVGQP